MMAIYRLEIKSISRRDGRSATAAAAYRSGSRIVDERTSDVHDYTRKQGIERNEIFLPENAPASLRERSNLWNAVEAAERRKDAKVARDMIAALPHELDNRQRVELARSMAHHLVERFGVGVDMAIHAPDRQGDQRNWHCHFLFTTRQIGPNGLGAKTRQLDVRQTASIEVQHLRERWQDFQNRSLEHAGLDERVDHRSLQDRGIERMPEPKLGPVATEIERSGRQSRAGDDVRHVRAENAALEAAIAQRKVIDLAIEREKRQLQQSEAQRQYDQAQQISVSAVLAQAARNEQERLSRQASDIRGRLDAQNSLQRFWFNLTGRNVRDRNELQEVESSRQIAAQRQHDAQITFEAEQQSRQLALQYAQQAAIERQQILDRQIPANDRQSDLQRTHRASAGRQVADEREARLQKFRDAFGGGLDRDGPDREM